MSMILKNIRIPNRVLTIGRNKGILIISPISYEYIYIQVIKFKKILRVNEVAQQNSYKDNHFGINNNHYGSIFGYNNKQDNPNDFLLNSESSVPGFSEERIPNTPQTTSYGIEEFKYKHF